jgi:hypothetical protein
VIEKDPHAEVRRDDDESDDHGPDIESTEEMMLYVKPNITDVISFRSLKNRNNISIFISFKSGSFHSGVCLVVTFSCLQTPTH